MRRLFLAICLLHLMTEASAWRRRRRRRVNMNGRNCRVSIWTSWSSCSHQCGRSGKQTRTRQKVYSEEWGGSCPYRFRETRVCNRDNCRNGGTPHSGGCSCRAGYGGTCCEQGESKLRSVYLTSRRASKWTITISRCSPRKFFSC